MVLKKRFTNLIKRPSVHEDPAAEGADTPEANAARGVRLFCESGSASTGEEVLHLPTIVEAAVASPAAAASAASQIRKFLSKENYARPHIQYNAVMIIRILADNPGPSFTKNLDKSFADTVKHLLRHGQDPSVAQILRETLNALEREKAYDTNLNTVFAMWKKEKGLMANAAKTVGPKAMNAPPWGGQQQQGGYNSGGGATPGGLPNPVELVARVEEARTSAKLLLQLVQSTPAHELIGNDLVKEFSERCMSAQRSLQGYINCDNPAPDDDTMLTLIETNEQLSLAASKHQRAVLQARRVQGASPSPPAPNTGNTPLAPLPVPATSYNAAPVSTHSPNPVTPYIPDPATTYSAPSHPPPQNEIPHLPSIGVGAREPPYGSNGHNTNELHLPSSLQAAPNRQQANAVPETEDNPFADHHSSGFAGPAGVSPPRRDETVSPITDYAPAPFNPGYQSTPSYLGRQDSSINNLTMHGGAQRDLTEEEEYARDYPSRTGTRTPEQTRAPQDSDVSPITERGTVTYRY